MSWEAWGTPDYLDDPDPVDSVEFPRERKPWKRDREAVAFAMRCGIQDRRARYPLGQYPTGGNYGCRDHVERMVMLMQAAQIRRSIAYEKQRGKQMRSVGLSELARAHRYLEFAGTFERVPLP